jgi:hypothetical protein
MDTEQEKKKAYYAKWHAANKDRQKARRAAWYAANKDRLKARSAAWHAANKDKRRAYMAAYQEANRDRLKAYGAAYQEANRDRIKAYGAAHYQTNRDRINACNAAWRAANAERVRACNAAWRRTRYQTSPNYRITVAIRNHLHRIVKSGGVKDAASISYVGCTAAQLRKHLERQFAPGMTWQNHGEWHIDHVVPLAAFDFAAFPAQIKQAEHYTNLRPIWARDNLSKCDTLPHPVQLDLIAV